MYCLLSQGMKFSLTKFMQTYLRDFSIYLLYFRYSLFIFASWKCSDAICYFKSVASFRFLKNHSLSESSFSFQILLIVTLTMVAMKMLLVLMVMVPTPVFAMMDSQEMDSIVPIIVKIIHAEMIKYAILCQTSINVHVIILRNTL